MLSLAGTCKGAVPPQRGRNGVRPMLWALGFGGLMLLWMVASSLLLAGAVAAGIVLLGHWQRGRRPRGEYAAFELLAARHSRGGIDGGTFPTRGGGLFEWAAGANP